MLNEKLLKDTLAYILLNPDRWEQGVWAKQKDECNTAMCFGGTAVLGAHPKAKFAGGYDDWNGTRIFYSMNIPKVGLVDIEQQARDDLGLTQDQADCLFHSENTLTQLINMVAELLADPNADLWEIRDYGV